MRAELRIFAIPGISEVTAGMDLGAEIADAIVRAGMVIEAGDVLVVAQKAVSKAEGAVVALADVRPSPRAKQWGAAHGKDPAVVEVVLRESRRIVRMERGIIIAETRHGFICANAGVDASNVPGGYVTLLPPDPDGSAARLQETLRTKIGQRIGIIVSDTFGRPWREGAVNVAIGVAGLRPLHDCRGMADRFGRRLQTTVIAIADEIASAAELVMGKTAHTPVAVVRGGAEWLGDGSAAMLVRAPALDLFR